MGVYYTSILGVLMSKFKNISLIPYNKNGYSLFFVIDNIGKRDFFFDFFVNNLIERRYAKNTVQLYSIAVASFLDYLIESIDYHTQKSTLIDGYKLAEIMSLFPIYLSSGESSSNETIKSISKSLSAIPKTGSTEETYIAGVNNYLALSEDFRSRINENKEDFVGFENISTEKLFPHFDKKVALSNSEKFNITNKNMLSSVISGGRNFKRLSALKTSKRKQNDSKEDMKMFPVDKVIKTIKEAKNELDKTLISLLAASGIRLSEALLLTFDDIDLEKREINIVSPHEKSLDDYYNYFTYEEKSQLPFKSRATKYTFLISPFEDYFWSSLLSYLKNERATTNAHPFIFTDKSSKPLIFSDKNFTQRFMTLSKKITGTKFTPHSMRHMYISYLINYFPVDSTTYGLPVHKVQKLVGHTNINSTQVYVHNDIELLRLQQKNYFINLNKPLANKSKVDLLIENLDKDNL